MKDEFVSELDTYGQRHYGYLKKHFPTVINVMRMKGTLEQYLDGNKKYQELLPIMARDREKLSEGFQPDKTEWLNKYDAILNEMSAMAEVEAFKYGFRLATAILLETAQ